MHFIQYHEKLNLIYLALMGQLSAQDAMEIADKSVAMLRSARRGINLVLDFRDFEPSADHFEYDYYARVIRVVLLKRPKNVFRLGGLDKFILINKACVEITAERNHVQITANSVENIIGQIANLGEKYTSFLEWFKTYDFNPFKTISEEDFIVDSQVDIVGFHIAGDFQVNSLMTFQVDVLNRQEKNVFYTFCYHSDDGKPGYDERNLIFMGDHADVMKNTCVFSFPKAGKYIVVVRAVPEPSAGISIGPISEICLNITIREAKAKQEQSRMDLSKKIFTPGSQLELIFNKETLKPIIFSTKLYNCNFKTEKMIVTETIPGIPDDFRYEDMEISTLLAISHNNKIRVGAKAKIIEYINDLKIPNSQRTVNGMVLKYSLPIRKVNLRLDRATYRLPFNANFEVKGILNHNRRAYRLGESFFVKDISITGIGFRVPKMIEDVLNPLTEIKVGDRAEVQLSMVDFRSAGSWVEISSYFSVVRRQCKEREDYYFVGAEITNLSAKDEESLTKFLSDAQLFDRSQARESILGT